MDTHELLALLKSQEAALHQPALRRDADFVARMLHDDFVEIGRSGTRYAKPDIIRLLTDESPDDPVQVWSQDYQLHLHDGNTALLLYKSAHVTADQALTRHTLRSSLWKRMPGGWQMLFHQGTATASFEPAQLNASAITLPASAST